MRFVDDIFSEIDGKKLADLTLGVFRMSKDYYNRNSKTGAKV